MQIIDGALCIRGSGEDRALVILEDIQPEGDVGVVVADRRRKFEIGAQEGASQVADQALMGIARIAPLLSPNFPSSGRVFRPVAGFMSERRIEALGVLKGLDRRHLDVVRSLRVVSLAAAAADIGAGAGEEGLCVPICSTAVNFGSGFR